LLSGQERQIKVQIIEPNGMSGSPPAAFASCLRDIWSRFASAISTRLTRIQRPSEWFSKNSQIPQRPAGSFNKGVSTRHLYRNGDFSKETARDSDRTKSQPEKEIPPRKATYRAR
jgi:hypothetical protein